MRTQQLKRDRITALEAELASLRSAAAQYVDTTARCCPMPVNAADCAAVLAAYDALKLALNITD